MHACIHTGIHTSMHTYIRIYKYIQIHACTCKYTHTYIHTNMYKHIQTNANTCKCIHTNINANTITVAQTPNDMAEMHGLSSCTFCFFRMANCAISCWLLRTRHATNILASRCQWCMRALTNNRCEKQMLTPCFGELLTDAV